MAKPGCEYRNYKPPVTEPLWGRCNQHACLNVADARVRARDGTFNRDSGNILIARCFVHRKICGLVVIIVNYMRDQAQ